MSSHQINGTAVSDATAQMTALDTGSTEIDVAQLAQLLSQVEPSAESETEITDLLHKLESADGIAKGVESRLDDILGNLNSLLASLETVSSPSTQLPHATPPKAEGRRKHNA
jgi:hypothetical protein